MIKVIFHTRAGKLIGFEVSGHAYYDEYGKDIVCASISILAINTINSIEVFTNDKINYSVKENGYLKFEATSDISSNTEILLKSFELGVTGVKEQYGVKYIQIYYEEV